MREKLLACSLQVFETGITPACAGKTYIQQFQFKEYEDHPRVCGKNSNGDIIAMPCPGSPPRVREKLLSFEASLLFYRITPASAGKTLHQR